MNCPCRSGRPFEDCCERLITHRVAAENAEALMRSRYTAFALGDVEYLMRSWHSRYRPAELELDAGLRWIGLEILGSGEGDGEAWVEFEARWLTGDRAGALRERSRFLREDGQWRYADGEALEPRFASCKPGRNSPCPCGSGRKFKRCCGK